MELPPEQLIRLLSMESKKTRKHMKMRRSFDQQKSRPAIGEPKIQRSPDQQNSRCTSDEPKPQDSDDGQKSRQVTDQQKTHRPPSQQAPRKKTTDRQERPEPKQVARPSHHMEYERNEPAVFHKRGPGWLPSALVIGLVAGVAVSGYLFWDPPSPPIAKQKKPAPVVSSEPQNRRMPQQQPKSPPVKRKAAPRSGETATLPAQALPPVKAPRTGNDAKWQAAIKTEQSRLRSAAEQRLAEQLVKMIVNREPEDLQAPPANEPTPPPAEPAFDQAAVSQPTPATAESPPTQHVPVEMIQADDAEPVAEAIPAVTPVQGIGSDGSGEMFEESTGLVDSFEQDTVPDVVPAIEQEPVSNIAPSLDENTATAFSHSIEGDSVSDVGPSTGPEMEAEQSSSGVSNESSSSASEDSALF
jgi:hypothetical protein